MISGKKCPDWRCKMQQVQEEYYTLEEVADRLKVSRRTVNRWIEEGELTAIKFAPGRGHVRVADSDLKDFIERHRTRPEGSSDA
jgi:excisionase family DNA binding protein